MIPGLRAAQQLVAAEHHDVRARGDAVDDRWLVAERGTSGGNAEVAAAEILGDRDAEAAAERDEVVRARGRSVNPSIGSSTDARGG